DPGRPVSGRSDLLQVGRRLTRWRAWRIDRGGGGEGPAIDLLQVGARRLRPRRLAGLDAGHSWTARCFARVRGRDEAAREGSDGEEQEKGPASDVERASRATGGRSARLRAAPGHVRRLPLRRGLRLLRVRTEAGAGGSAMTPADCNDNCDICVA